MAGLDGIEPPPKDLETLVLPLNYRPINMAPHRGIEPL